MNWLNRYAPLRAPDDAAASVAPAEGAAPAGGAGSAGEGAAQVAAEGAPAASGEAASAAPPTDSSAAPAADAAPAEHKSEPSLLEAAVGKKPEAKPEGDPPTDTPAPASDATSEGDKKADAEGDKKPDAKADESKKDEASKGDDPATDATAQQQPPAPLKYEAFKVPEGFQLDDAKLGKFTEVLGAAQVPQTEVQKLVDLYADQMKADADSVRAEQRRVWDKLNDTWKTDLRNDKELGGNRLETSLSMAKAVIEEYGGTPEQKAELMAHTTNNGMGNYPGFIRLLHNIGQALNVFEDGMVPASPNPPKPSKSPGNRGWYDNSMGKGNGAAAS